MSYKSVAQKTAHKEHVKQESEAYMSEYCRELGCSVPFIAKYGGTCSLSLLKFPAGEKVVYYNDQICLWTVAEKQLQQYHQDDVKAADSAWHPVKQPWRVSIVDNTNAYGLHGWTSEEETFATIDIAKAFVATLPPHRGRRGITLDYAVNADNWLKAGKWKCIAKGRKNIAAAIAT